MPTKIHFISGLPRSGSTLLSALLRQNPAFHAAVTSPLAMLNAALLQKMSGNSEFSVFFDDPRRTRILRGAFDSYYADIPPDDVVFDTNRTWTGKAGLLSRLYPNSRIICCVREVGWILDSVERMHHKNPTQLSRLFNYKQPSSVYARVDMLMNHDNGLVGRAWATLREAWFGTEAKRLIVIQYDSLAREPARVLKRLYEEINEPAFEHDFEAVAYNEAEYDRSLGLPGLHTVRPKVQLLTRQSSLPPDLLAKYADINFWAKPDLNRRQVTIL
jgi:sulfotransferase